MSRQNAKIPAIILTFANEFTQSGFLRKLTTELKAILNAFEPAIQEGKVHLKIIPAATQRELTQVFQDPWYEDRIAIFHYGGHADEDELWLEDASGSNRSFFSVGLARFLAAHQQNTPEHRKLYLVFLNGCATHEQAQLLIDAGVPAVIATSRKIDDTQATLFAEVFYRGLAASENIIEAFGKAEGVMLAMYGPKGHSQTTPEGTRSLFWENQENESNAFPWRLYMREGAESGLQLWRLYYKLAETPEDHEKFEIEDLIGMEINNHLLDEYLGSGTFGMVFLAHHAVTREKRAIKISHKILSGYQDLLNIIVNGNIGISSINHPNVVKFYDVGEALLFGQKRIYIVMEFVDGKHLQAIDFGISYLSRSELKTLVDFALQICSGVQAAHTTQFTDASGVTREGGIIHGNLNPKKIMFTSGGLPKIIDFLFVDLSSSRTIKLDTPPKINQKRQMELGDYYPPEVLNASTNINKQTDIYALGAIFFEVATGKKFSQQTLTSVGDFHDFLQQHNDNFPRYISHILYKASHPDPQDRYQTVEEMIKDFWKQTSFFQRVVYWFKGLRGQGRRS